MVVVSARPGLLNLFGLHHKSNSRRHFTLIGKWRFAFDFWLPSSVPFRPLSQSTPRL
jgi:hypothetical protein